MDGSGVRLARAWARDVIGAVALVESAIAHRVFVAVEWPEMPASNAFGEPLACERGSDVRALVRKCAEAAAAGERVALVACAPDLAAARGELARIAAQRLGVVVHAIAEAAAPDAPVSLAGMAAAFSLGDLPWGMLLGAGVVDAFDLALVARRAAEDSGCPFFVVHERSLAHHVEPIAAPSRELCDAFVGSLRAPARRASIPPTSSPSTSDRAFAERVPFALASAMREIEALTGRHHDVIERAPGGDTAVALVGAGSLGESLIADLDRLRAGGHDVGAVRVVAWRPFPAARLVKAIGRALAVTVLERVDQPLASNAPLAGQLKAAFADALTWAPDYPGIGRIPRIVSGVLAPHREVDSTDLDAIVHNLLADERGKRSFVVGGDDAHALAAAPITRAAGKTFAMRGIASRREVAAAAAELCVAVLASALGLRTRVTVRALPVDEGGGVAFDLVAARDRPRGVHAPHAMHVVALDDPGLLARGNPLSRLAPGGLLAVPSRQRAADGLWAEIPPWAKAIVFDRGARVLGWSPAPADEDAWVSAAAFVGVALAAATTDLATGRERSIEAPVVAREVGDALRVALEGAADAATIAERGGSVARHAFEAHVEVPRATIEREDDGVRLGRRDARVNSGLQ